MIGHYYQFIQLHVIKMIVHRQPAGPYYSPQAAQVHPLAEDFSE